MTSDTDHAGEPARREAAAENEALPFSVHIVDRASGDRLLARAATPSLAQAIFGAARNEYPHGRVVLKRGPDTVLDSATG